MRHQRLASSSDFADQVSVTVTSRGSNILTLYVHLLGTSIP